MSRWEGEWIDTADLDGPWPAAKWPAWARQYAAAYDLFRHRRTNGGVLRCRTCDYAVCLPVYPWPDMQVRAVRWMAEHTLTHAAHDGVILAFEEGDDSPEEG